MDVGDLRPSESLPIINELVYGFLEKHLMGNELNIYERALNNDLIIRY